MYFLLLCGKLEQRICLHSLKIFKTQCSLYGLSFKMFIQSRFAIIKISLDIGLKTMVGPSWQYIWSTHFKDLVGDPVTG